MENGNGKMKFLGGCSSFFSFETKRPELMKYIDNPQNCKVCSLILSALHNIMIWNADEKPWNCDIALIFHRK